MQADASMVGVVAPQKRKAIQEIAQFFGVECIKPASLGPQSFQGSEGDFHVFRKNRQFTITVALFVAEQVKTDSNSPHDGLMPLGRITCVEISKCAPIEGFIDPRDCFPWRLLIILNATS